MGLKLTDINHHIVDLRTSVFDESKTSRKDGVYFFKVKKYISYTGDAPVPEFWFEWARWNDRDNYRDVMEHEMKGYTFLTPDDNYWPEPLRPLEGKYRIGDAVLMKRPLIDELDEREERAKLNAKQRDVIGGYESSLGEDKIPAKLKEELLDPKNR